MRDFDADYALVCIAKLLMASQDAAYEAQKNDDLNAFPQILGSLIDVLSAVVAETMPDLMIVCEDPERQKEHNGLRRSFADSREEARAMCEATETRH